MLLENFIRETDKAATIQGSWRLLARGRPPAGGYRAAAGARSPALDAAPNDPEHH